MRILLAIRLACAALSAGIIISLYFFRMAHSIILIMPLTGRIWPSSASSPANIRFAVSEVRSCSESVRMLNAIGKSSDAPVFAMLAGARLMMILRRGKMKPELRMAERIRSRLSSMVRLGRPVIVKLGRP